MQDTESYPRFEIKRSLQDHYLRGWRRCVGPDIESLRLGAPEPWRLPLVRDRTELARTLPERAAWVCWAGYWMFAAGSPRTGVAPLDKSPPQTETWCPTIRMIFIIDVRKFRNKDPVNSVNFLTSWIRNRICCWHASYLQRYLDCYNIRNFPSIVLLKLELHRILNSNTEFLFRKKCTFI